MISVLLLAAFRASHAEDCEQADFDAQLQHLEDNLDSESYEKCDSWLNEDHSEDLCACVEKAVDYLDDESFDCTIPDQSTGDSETARARIRALKDKCENENNSEGGEETEGGDDTEGGNDGGDDTEGGNGGESTEDGEGSTPEPTAAPTVRPTVGPTEAPTEVPTVAPTMAPTTAQTKAPTAPTAPKESSSGGHGGLVAGILLSVIAVALLVFVFCWHKEVMLFAPDAEGETPFARFVGSYCACFASETAPKPTIQMTTSEPSEPAQPNQVPESTV